MRIIKSSPPDLASLLFDLGPRILVLVEGESDCRVFEEWFQDQLGEVMFSAPGGGMSGVERRLQEVLAHSSKKRAFGIVDRDFRSSTEVEACLNDPNAHLFILRRYAIENYLLEPAAIREELRVYYGSDYVVPDENAIADDLLNFCQQLRIKMVAHWVFHEVGGIEYFSEGHDISDGKEFIQQIASKLGCSVVQARRHVKSKEKQLDPLLTTLEMAHICTNGKHLMHLVYAQYIANVQRGMLKTHFFNLLARTVKRMGLHPDITMIVEERILKHL